MSTWLSILSFVVGIALVVKGGDWFVDAASFIAKAARIPTFIIGATVVSFATTLPEMIVSVLASIEGKNDMAIGNAIGSVTANTGLIMAIAFIFMSIAIVRKKYMKQCLILILSAAVLWVGCLTGTMQLWCGIVLACLFLTFMTVSILDAKNSPEEPSTLSITKSIVTKNIFLFILGAACIVIGSNFLINGGSDIARLLGVPERVIAITMVAIGTSLPELVTTVTAIVKKETSLSIGNIVGANIIDVCLILPVCTLISGAGFTVSEQSLRFDFPACIIVSIIALIPLLIRQKASRLQGILMFLFYVAYLIFTI